MSILRVGRSLVSGLTKSGVQVAFLDATKAANEAVTRHGITSPVHAEALARTMSGAVLLNMNMKGEERVELQILAQDETAPVQRVHAESIFTGEVRGYVQPTGPEPADELPPGAAPYRGPADGLGNAPVLHVSKVLYDSAAKQQSYVTAPGGSVERGLQHYFERSEQVDTFVHLVTEAAAAGAAVAGAPSREGQPLALFARSGATFAQRLPGVDDAAWQEVLAALTAPEDVHADVVRDAAGPPTRGSGSSSSSSSSASARTAGLQAAMEAHLPGLAFDPSAWHRKPVDFFCRCTRDNYLAGLRSLDAASRRDLASSGGPGGAGGGDGPAVEGDPVVVTCHHCNTNYAFSPAEVLGDA